MGSHEVDKSVAAYLETDDPGHQSSFFRSWIAGTYLWREGVDTSVILGSRDQYHPDSLL
jgi:hypothetical protein